ncbi:MAG: NAD(P)-dependent oxidoreductase [Phycisphaerales bacterium]|nr:MAG: NAD(P)-dependent oxidoreductase [Phycisphaerales bacterium]
MTTLAGSTVALLGATGMLGRALAQALRSRGVRLVVVGRDQVDLADPDTIDRMPACDVLLNAAAWTDVDAAEANEPLATQVNGHAIARLLAVDRIGLLVTFGTDYVFDGRAREPYAVDHPRRPINAYGRSKAVGESALESVDRERWLHVRTSWLYAPWGRNFVLTMHRLLAERPLVRVVDDQRGRPTSAEHLASVTLALIERGARGHWHATDGGSCTWYELAAEVGRLTGAAATLEPCGSDQFPRPAARPAYSVLDLSATEAALGPMPHWKENLADALRRVREGTAHA